DSPVVFPEQKFHLQAVCSIPAQTPGRRQNDLRLPGQVFRSLIGRTRVPAVVLSPPEKSRAYPCRASTTSTRCFTTSTTASTPRLWGCSSARMRRLRDSQSLELPTL